MERSEWLKERQYGIGASEAAAVLGVSPYMTNVELWEIKTGRRQAVDIADKAYVQYGLQAEKHIRALFALDYTEYNVDHQEYEIFRNSEHPFIFATPDGKLVSKSEQQKGGLEIKTTEIIRAGQWDEWNSKVPQHYYIQLLHSLLATGWGYWYLRGQIKWHKNGQLQITTRDYLVVRHEVAADLKFLLEKEIVFQRNVETDKKPNLILPMI